MRLSLSIVLITLMLIPLVSAHLEEGDEPPKIISFIWALHSWTHWIVWILFIYTCYYFRSFLGRLSGHPLYCMKEENIKEYSKENAFKQVHGVFVWIMIVWTIIHFSELVGAQMGYSELPVYSLAAIIPGEEIWEWAYISSTFLFLFSCHYLRYLGGSGVKCFSCRRFGKERHTIFVAQTILNNYHGYLFWVAIIASALVLLSGGHL